MLAEELKLNPIFRAPEEYDVYKMDEEAPKKINKQKRKERITVHNDEYGEQMLQQFKNNDKTSAIEIDKTFKAKQRNWEFEKALVVQATAYLEKVVDRRNPDVEEKALTVRKAVGESHAQLYREGFRKEVETRFGKSHLYGEAVKKN